MTDTIPVPREELERIREVLTRLRPISRTTHDEKGQALASLDRILNTKTE